MRNWNSKSYKKRIFIFMLRAYLWGIETVLALSQSKDEEQLRAYLWGIETKMRIEKIWRSIWLRAYLWGIETHQPSTLPPHHFLLRAYLWGIETTYWTGATNFLSLVASLPMRNWNSKQMQELIVNYLVASLPMRNWNTKEDFEEIKEWIGCEPTYEELKLLLLYQSLKIS